MKNYVPTTLDQYINESKSITLKRGYRGQNPVVVGANAPVRNQILSYVAESKRVGVTDLKRFIAGLNETNENPNAAANMWLRRNGKYFVTESKAGRTFYKLSTLGQRLVNSFGPPANVNEQKKQEPKVNLVSKLLEMVEENPELEPEAAEAIDGYREQYADFDEELGEVDGKDKYVPILKQLILDLGGSLSDEEAEMEELPAEELSAEEDVYEAKKYDFKDPKTDKPGIVDDEDEEVDECSTNEAVEVNPKKAKARLGGKLDPKLHNLLDKDEDKDEGEIDGFTKEISEEAEGLSAERKARIEAIIENIKSRKTVVLNEEEDEDKEEEKEEGEESSDELSFDDLDLSGEGGEGGEEKEEEGEEKEEEGEEEEAEGEEEEAEGEEEEGEGDEEKVEITEFILTVDDVDSAISELEELGVEASKVVDPDAEPEEGEEEAYKADEISVEADNWDALKGWLEEKGVDVEEMFGGEIEVEDVDDEDLDAEEGGEDLDLEDIDLEGGEEGGEEDVEMDLDLEGGDDSEELELDAEEEPEVEESLTGMEKHEDELNNLIKGAKQVVINYK